MTLSNTKIETGAALIGAGLGAIGALLIEPIVIGIGAVLAATATFARINDRTSKGSRQSTKSPKVAAYR